MSYSSGNYYVICARCGCKRLRSDTMLDMSGGNYSTKPTLLVCKEHFDGVHPQTRPTPNIRSRNLRPDEHRPDDGSEFRTFNTWDGSCDVWEAIAINWENYGNPNSVAEISKTLVGKD